MWLSSRGFCDGPCARTRPSLFPKLCRPLEDPTESSASAENRREGNERVAKLARALRSEKPVAVGRRTAYRAARDYIDLGPATIVISCSRVMTARFAPPGPGDLCFVLPQFA